MQRDPEQFQSTCYRRLSTAGSSPLTHAPRRLDIQTLRLTPANRPVSPAICHTISCRSQLYLWHSFATRGSEAGARRPVLRPFSVIARCLPSLPCNSSLRCFMRRLPTHHWPPRWPASVDGAKFTASETSLADRTRTCGTRLGQGARPSAHLVHIGRLLGWPGPASASTPWRPVPFLHRQP